MKISEPLVIAKKIDPAKRRAAGERLAANVRRINKRKGGRTAAQALADARGERFGR